MGQTDISNRNSAEDLSRRKNWKIVRRLLSTVLLFSGILTLLYYLQLNQKFENHRIDSRAQDENIISSLYLQSEQRLQQLFNLIISLPAVSESLIQDNSNRLLNSFNPYWSNMEYEWNLDHVGFYSDSANLLGKWSSRPADSGLNTQINHWIQQVDNSKQAMNIISCLHTCSHYLITPIVIEGRNTGTAVIATSLLGVVNRFHHSTGKTIGLLTPAKEPTTSVNLLTYKWGYSLYSLTDAGKFESVLHAFTDQKKPQQGAKQFLTAQKQDQEFELSLYPLTPTADSFLITLENISHELDSINRQTLYFAAITFLITLIFQMFLYLSLKRHSDNPAVASEPSLETDDEDNEKTVPEPFMSADNTLSHSTHTPIDFDLTSDSIMSITDRLDQLKQYNQDINQELAKQMIKLSQERDQVKKILDNTQAIIMTLRQDGVITSINRFGQMITGYSEKELKGKSFIDLYPDKVPFALNDLQTLSSIALGNKESFRHEARLSCKDGKERVILWLHSRLNSELSNSTPLLAAGLDITEHKQLEKNLSWLADHDSLTSLYNRRRFEEELNDALLWANNHQANGALLYIDLDNFKDINDSCGHQVGDVILRKVASSLTNLTSEMDSSAHQITARLGGDEFAIILRNIDKEGISSLSKRILETLYQIRHNQNNINFQLSCSIGIATFPGIETNANELLSNADFAMYQAKLYGRNQFYIFKEDDSHREQTQQRIIWREKIETAFRDNKFILHYQPILNIEQRNISHYETLIRMQGENGELVSPSVFINIAERLGLIQEIDAFIVSSAIAKQGELTRNGHDIKLAINLSGKAFDDPNLFANIKQAIDEYQAKPENLIFEITETTAVSDMMAAEKIMSQIQSLGCQFALDDFGIGFSSFYYLRELPVDYVKIDGSFVKDLPNNSDNQVLVKALSEVSIGFNKLSVAEFVDSLQTLHILSEAKVNYAQGYFIGKPSEKIPVDPPNFYQAAVKENTALL